MPDFALSPVASNPSREVSNLVQASPASCPIPKNLCKIFADFSGPFSEFVAAWLQPIIYIMYPLPQYFNDDESYQNIGAQRNAMAV